MFLLMLLGRMGAHLDKHVTAPELLRQRTNTVHHRILRTQMSYLRHLLRRQMMDLRLIRAGEIGQHRRESCVRRSGNGGGEQSRQVGLASGVGLGEEFERGVEDVWLRGRGVVDYVFGFRP